MNKTSTKSSRAIKDHIKKVRVYEKKEPKKKLVATKKKKETTKMKRKISLLSQLVHQALCLIRDLVHWGR